MAHKKSKTYTPKFKFQLVLRSAPGRALRGGDRPGLRRPPHHYLQVEAPQFLEHSAEVFGSNEEVERYEKRIAELERLVGQKEIELALLKNFMGGS